MSPMVDGIDDALAKVAPVRTAEINDRAPRDWPHAHVAALVLLVDDLRERVAQLERQVR